MKFNSRNWVTLIASVWMSFTVSVMEGVRPLPNPLIEAHGHVKHATAKRWAVLVAGSKGYDNYSVFYFCFCKKKFILVLENIFILFFTLNCFK